MLMGQISIRCYPALWAVVSLCTTYKSYVPYCIQVRIKLNTGYLKKIKLRVCCFISNINSALMFINVEVKDNLVSFHMLDRCGTSLISCGRG